MKKHEQEKKPAEMLPIIAMFSMATALSGGLVGF
jgi:hypothetical protein